MLANNELIEKVLAYGRDLKILSVVLKQEHGTNPANKRALEVLVHVYFLCGFLSEISSVTYVRCLKV